MTRYKNQVKDLEEREDQLMKEKRLQAKEVRMQPREVHRSVRYCEVPRLKLAIFHFTNQKFCLKTKTSLFTTYSLIKFIFVLFVVVVFICFVHTLILQPFYITLR